MHGRIKFHDVRLDNIDMLTSLIHDYRKEMALMCESPDICLRLNIHQARSLLVVLRNARVCGVNGIDRELENATLDAGYTLWTKNCADCELAGVVSDRDDSWDEDFDDDSWDFDDDDEEDW